MTTPTRHAKVRRASAPSLAPRPVVQPPLPPPAPPRKPVSFERVLLWSLLFSVVLHVLILIVSPLFIRVGAPPGGVVAAGDAAPGIDAGRLRGIVPIASDAAPDDAAPTVVSEAGDPASAADRPEPRDPSRTPSTGELTDAAPGEPGAAGAGRDADRRSVGDALRPGFSDGRLWVNPRELRIEREESRHELYMEHLQARIDASNDSLYGRGPDTDWTTRDGKGRRWGVSEEGVHLGGITIPRGLIPIPSTGTSQDQEEVRERERQRREIQRQEDDRAREEALERSRKAAEQRRKDGGGGG